MLIAYATRIEGRVIHPPNGPLNKWLAGGGQVLNCTSPRKFDLVRYRAVSAESSGDAAKEALDWFFSAAVDAGLPPVVDHIRVDVTPEDAPTDE